jgi:hypothetical protein
MLRYIVICDMDFFKIEVIKTVVFKGLFFDVIENAFAGRLPGLCGRQRQVLTTGGCGELK